MRRTYGEVRQDDVPLLSAGVAFWWFIAFFPTIVASLLLYGLVADAEALVRRAETIGQVIPGVGREVVVAQVERLTTHSDRAIGFSLFAALATALWTASAGVAGIVKAVNVAFDIPERRSWVRRRLISLGVTVGAVAVLAIAVGLLAITPLALERIELLPSTRTSLQIARWPVLVVIFAGALTLLYRFAPVRRPEGWPARSPGVVLATATWLGASVAFTAYVQTVARYDSTYGGIAGVVVLLLWLFATAFVILVGAELDAEARRLAREAAETVSGPLSDSGRADAPTGPGEPDHGSRGRR